MNVNIFKVAMKEGFRYPYKGNCTTEDLFQLSLAELDGIFKKLNSEVKQSNEESLLSTRTKESSDLDTRIEIVKSIVAEKLEERSSRLLEKENADKKQRLMSILDRKQNEALEGLSAEEIQKMIDGL